MTIIKRKFEHVGLGKIDRDEWMLQDHHTGHVLNVNRHWNAIVKVLIPSSSTSSMSNFNTSQPGQTLDMSMIFRRPKLLSIVCPWCNSENKCSLDEQHVEWYVTLVDEIGSRIDKFFIVKNAFAGIDVLRR